MELSLEILLNCKVCGKFISQQVYYRAVGALVKVGEPAVEPLIQVLEDENWKVRLVAAMALGGIKDERAVNPLINQLE